MRFLDTSVIHLEGSWLFTVHIVPQVQIVEMEFCKYKFRQGSCPEKFGAYFEQLQH